MQKIKNIISKHPNWIAAMLLFIMFALAIGSARKDSAIVDEIAHIPAGYSYLKYGDYRLNVEHPPLIKDLAGLPLQFMNLKFPENAPAWQTDVNGQWESGWHFIYHIGNDANKIIFWSRFPMILIMLLLGLYLYKAAKEWFGQNAALFALTLYAFCPNIIAHGRFVTTDVGAAAFIFIAIYYFSEWIKFPDWKNAAKASLALALAQLAKFSAVLIIPVFILITLAAGIIAASKKTNKTYKTYLTETAKYAGRLLIIFISAFILLGIFYYPHVKNMPVGKIRAQIETGLYSNKAAPIKSILDKMADIPILRPHAYYLTGFAMVIGRVAGGNTTYFLGKVTNQSFRAYFPVVYLAKTPLATLLLIAIAIIASILPLQRLLNKDEFFQQPIKREKRWIIIATFLLFIFVYAYTSIMGNLNIGFRHLIPMLPPIFALVGYEISKIISRFKPAGYIAAGLLIWLAGANFLAYPRYAAYFNEAAGGIKNGYKIVTDSNVDWGQDLIRLKEWIDDYNNCAINRPKDPRCSVSKFGKYPEKAIDTIKIDYFGGGAPQYYFCDRKYDNAGQLIAASSGYDCSNSPYREWHANNGQTSGWIAVSATFLQNSLWYKQQFGEQDYQWLRERRPLEIIGGSILVYYID